MPVKNNSSQQIIQTLTNGSFFIECPECGDEIALKKAGLFHQDNFSAEALAVYENHLELIRNRKAALKKLKEKGPSRSESGAHHTNIGFIMERIAPTMPGFRFKHNDCRAIFDPIDYVIFEGLTTQREVDHIYFVDIKSGAAKLSSKQKDIRRVIQDKKISFKKF
jgi:predicted Holliday junction resolvase-like endonuclease